MRFLTRSVFLFCLSLFSVPDISAQTPEFINYQAVARNIQTGLELANTPIFISCMIRANGPNGNIVFQENHNSVDTDDFGLFAIQIGSGSIVTGSLGNINWSSGTYWLDVEVDAGDGLQSAGTMQLVAVPYALHARTADNVDDDDADPTNELVENLSLVDNVQLLLEQNNGANNLTVDLSDFSDGDNDPTNELVNELSFNTDTRDLFLAQNDGSSFTTNIGGVDDADADPTNELVENLSLIDNNQLLLEQNNGASNLTVDLSNFSDGDNDPTNELVNELSFNTDTRDLFLAQNDGSSFTTNIGGVDDADADPTNELVNEFSFNPGDRTLFLAQNDGSTFSANIGGVDDADADPLNEMVETLEFDNDTRTLSLTQGEGPELSTVIPNQDLLWEYNEGEDAVYNDQNQIGIGLTAPDARLTVRAQSSSEYGLEVQDNSGDVIFQAGEPGVGVGAPNVSNSNVYLHGATAFTVRVINDENFVPQEIIVGQDDFLLVLNFSFTFGGPMEIIMPDPADFPGREIIIKRIGVTGSTQFVILDFGGANVDGFAATVAQNIGSFTSIATKRYISAGSLGWITL